MIKKKNLPYIIIIIFYFLFFGVMMIFGSKYDLKLN